jgi:hypothetical protein
VHESILEYRLRYFRCAVGLRHERHVLRLHVGRKQRMRLVVTSFAFKPDFERLTRSVLGFSSSDIDTRCRQRFDHSAM